MMATLCSLCCGSGETTASSAQPFWVGSAGPWIFVDRDSVPWRHVLNYLRDKYDGVDVVERLSQIDPRERVLVTLEARRLGLRELESLMGALRGSRCRRSCAR